MIQVSVDDLVVNGRLGPLRPGMTPDEVVQLIGPPEDVGASRSTRFLWKYGDLELFFWRERSCLSKRHLVSIALYFRHGPFRTTAPIDLCGFVPEPWTQPTDCGEHFRILGVSYYRDPLIDKLCQGEQITLVAGVGVHFVFGVNERGGWDLDSIQFTQRRQSATRA